MGGLDLRHVADDTIASVPGLRHRAPFVLLAALGLGCPRKDAAPEGVTALKIEDPREHWNKEGFVELVPPVHLPSSDHQIDQVEIWAKLPDGGTITEVEAASGAPIGLKFPPGSVLDRVEYANHQGKRFVVDVRGTRIADDGSQWFHVYRRGEAGLFGFEWARSDEAAHGRATAALLERLATVEPGKSMDETRRAAFLRDVEGKNACAQCHAISREINTTQREHGLVNRGTDASGFFTPWTLFADAIPLETYGGNDRSETDPWVTISCPDGGEPTAAKDGRARCAENAVPLGTYDLNGALREADPRALRICTGRRALGEHLSDALGLRFASALRQCEHPG